MYPAMFYTLKCLIFRCLLKIANISSKIDILSYIKSLESREIAVPLFRFFVNTDIEKAVCDRYRFLGLYAVCPYAI